MEAIVCAAADDKIDGISGVQGQPCVKTRAAFFRQETAEDLSPIHKHVKIRVAGYWAGIGAADRRA